MTRRPRDPNCTESADLLLWLSVRPAKWHELVGRFVIFHKDHGIIAIGNDPLDVLYSQKEDISGCLFRHVPDRKDVTEYDWVRALQRAQWSTERRIIAAIAEWYQAHGRPNSAKLIEEGEWRKFLPQDS